MTPALLLCSKNQEFLKGLYTLTCDLGYLISTIEKVDNVESLAETFKPSVIIIESSSDESEMKELVLALRMRFKSANIMIIYTKETAINFTLLKEMVEVSLIQRPFEEDLLMPRILELAPVLIPVDKLKLAHLYPIHVKDINIDSEFNFDLFIYLAINKKILLYRNRNSKFTTEQLQKLKSQKAPSLYIRLTDKKLFLEMLSVNLRKRGIKKISPHVFQREEIERKIKEVFVGFFDSSKFDYGRSQEVIGVCKHTLGKYIAESELTSELFEQLRCTGKNSNGNYDHAIDVAIFATIFSLALGQPEFEAAAIGALLHDIGMALLPVEFQDLPFDELTDAQKTIYQNHPMSGAGLLRKKNVAATDAVYKVIQQHHEHFDGSGYPLGVKGENIHILARICQIADELAHLTNNSSSSTQLSPKEALDQMVRDNQIVGQPVRFDQQILVRLAELCGTSFSGTLGKEGLRELERAPIPLVPETAEDREKRKLQGGKPWRFTK